MTSAYASHAGYLPKAHTLRAERIGLIDFGLREHWLSAATTAWRLVSQDIVFMKNIFAARHPFEIFNPVVVFDAVNVVYKRLAKRIGTKGRSDQAVHKLLGFIAEIICHSDFRITLGCYKVLHQFRFALDVPKGADLIARKWRIKGFPFFHGAMLYTALRNSKDIFHD